MTRANEVAAAALAAVGARFRFHGREPDSGLDCVGLVAWATGVEAPTGYALRGGDPAAAAAMLDGVLMRVEDATVGDVLLMRTGSGQLHLGVWTADGLVHADAGLRRVVVRPGAVEWPVLGRWRVGLPSPDLASLGHPLPEGKG